MTSVHEFWNLLATSRLVSADQLGKLQTDFSALRGADRANAVLLAEWLISEDILTRFQAGVLRGGQSGPFHFSDFLLLERIESGPSSNCFRALHRPSGHQVLFVLIENGKPDSRLDWLTICKTYAQYLEVESKHLAGPLELVESEDTRFAVMEDLGGTALSEVLLDGHPLPLSASAAIAESVARGLAALHAAGLAHGDVRPENIWLPRKGSARLLLLPETLAIHGPDPPLEWPRAEYTAPEIDPAHATPTVAGDIYALGCTIYQMLAGTPPFFRAGDGETAVAAIMQRHALQPIVPLDSQDGIPASFNQVVSYMMAKDIHVRYTSVETLVEILPRFVEANDVPRDHPPLKTYHSYLIAARQRRAEVLRAAMRSASPRSSTGLKTITGAPHLHPAIAEPKSEDWSELFRQSDPADHTTRFSARAAARRPKSRLRFALALSFILAFIVILLLFRFNPDAPRDKLATATATPQLSELTPGEASNPREPLSEETNGVKEKDSSQKQLSKSQGKEHLVKDDGKRLWGSPTAGEPPDIRYLPRNPQALLILRPEGLMQKRGEHAVLEAIGPSGPELLAWIVAETGFAASELDQLDVGLYDGFSDRMRTVLVARLPRNSTRKQLLSRWGNPSEATYNGTRYYRSGEKGFYLPGNRNDVFATAGIDDIEQIIDFLDEPSWLSTPMESLAAAADADRHINLFFAANFVRSARETLYPGQLAPLHDGIDWLLGPQEEVQAGLLSLHFSDNFFSELRLYGVRDKQPKKLAADFYERFEHAANKMQAHLDELVISKYSRTLLANLPEMLLVLHQYMRHDRDRLGGRQAVLRAYLPENAAVYLAMAAELTLLETAGIAAGKPQTDDGTISIEEALRQPASLVFDRDSLLAAAALLSDELGISIVIQGEDLQKEGITKNQSFGINIRDRPAQEILIQILLAANPDKNLSGPDDPKLKLVYIVPKTAENGKEVLWITTRAAAALRNDTIPEIFQTSP